MGAYTVQIPELVYELDAPFVNYSGTDIPANYLVAVDTTYYLGPTPTPTGPADGVGIVLPSGAGVKVIGVTLEIIKAGASGVGYAGLPGRVRCFGPIAPFFCTGAITVGSLLEADGTTVGYVKAYSGPAFQIGIALNATGATGDQLQVLMMGANNQ